MPIFDPAVFDPAVFDALAPATASQQAWRTSADGKRIGYWVDGGAIKGAVYDAGDTDVISTFTAIASGVDDRGIAMKESYVDGGEHRIVLFYFGSGLLQEAQSSDGFSFS